MNPIRDAWQSYDQQVVPKDAGDAQRLETRRAFYAGAMALKAEFSLIGDMESPEAADRAMETIIRELEHFQSGIGRGN